ncbi:hypothetical protein TNCV_4561671 [Trichonephila clavipes]|nr:hypothetical protein TNCV_4561671 [Trichonephila clavipes]
MMGEKERPLFENLLIPKTPTKTGRDDVPQSTSALTKQSAGGEGKKRREGRRDGRRQRIKSVKIHLRTQRRRRCGVFINLLEVEAEIAFETLLDSVGVVSAEMRRSVGGKNIQCRPYGPIAQNISVCVCPAWVPAGMFGIKISEKKGFVAMVENCIEFRSINGAVWRSLNTRYSNLTVVTYLNDDR